MTEIIKILEIAGTIAFSVSGALIACGAGLDIFGVVFVGCTTAIGGGIIRDVVLGIHPPTIFTNYLLFILAVFTSVITFIIAYINKEKFHPLKSKIDTVNNYFDAVGLAVFSVIGAEAGFVNGHSHNVFIIVLCGMITGVGGGIIRDIMIGTTPYVFKKHVYALASILGSLLYYLLRYYLETVSLASGVTIFCVILIRILATKYRWELPKMTWKK